MNQANAKALAGLWRQAVERLGSSQIENADAAARFLAAQGVLVPSALTDDELISCDMDGERLETPAERAQAAAFVRAQLERIANGEPQPHRVGTIPAASRPAKGMRRDPKGTSIIPPSKDSDPS